jgi:hypothetical protein
MNSTATRGLKSIALGQFIQIETRLKVYCSSPATSRGGFNTVLNAEAEGTTEAQ